MTKRFVFGVGLLVASAAAAGVWAWQKPTFESALKDACTSVLAQRLKAPSTFKVTSWGSLVQRNATLEEYAGKPPTAAEFGSRLAEVKKLYDDMVSMFDEGEDGIALLDFEYEAANSFGVPIRGFARCSYVFNRPSDDSKVFEPSVKIDGKSHMDWLISRM